MDELIYYLSGNLRPVIQLRTITKNFLRENSSKYILLDAGLELMTSKSASLHASY